MCFLELLEIIVYVSSSLKQRLYFFLFSDILSPVAYASAGGIDSQGAPATIDATPTGKDADTFSEISLDQLSDFEAYPPQSPVYSPLQDVYPSSNPLLQGTASTINALSQLPSVASNVLSSFSSILRGTSPGVQPSQLQPLHQPPPPQPWHQPTPPALQPISQYQTSSHQDTDQQEYPSYPVIQPPPIQEPVGPPPRLYSPNDSSLLPAAPPAAPPSSSSANTYRLNAKRKIYAPLPGLNTSALTHEPLLGSIPAPSIPTDTAALFQPNTEQSSSTVQPPIPQHQYQPEQPQPPQIQYPPPQLQYQPPHPQYQPQQTQYQPPQPHYQPTPVDNQKSGAFSLTNLFGSTKPLLDKFSQVTGISQPAASEYHQQPFEEFSGIGSATPFNSVPPTQVDGPSTYTEPTPVNPNIFNTNPLIKSSPLSQQSSAIPTPYQPTSFFNPSVPIAHEVTPLPPSQFYNPDQFQTSQPPPVSFFNPTQSVPVNSLYSQPTQSIPPTSSPLIPPTNEALTRCVYPISNQFQQNSSALPPPSVAPPSGTSARNYRLKGKPLYKAPVDAFGTTPVAAGVFPQTQAPTQPISFFNPATETDSLKSNLYTPATSQPELFTPSAVTQNINQPSVFVPTSAAAIQPNLINPASNQPSVPTISSAPPTFFATGINQNLVPSPIILYSAPPTVVPTSIPDQFDTKPTEQLFSTLVAPITQINEQHSAEISNALVEDRQDEDSPPPEEQPPPPASQKDFISIKEPPPPEIEPEASTSYFAPPPAGHLFQPFAGPVVQSYPQQPNAISAAEIPREIPTASVASNFTSNVAQSLLSDQFAQINLSASAPLISQDSSRRSSGASAIHGLASTFFGDSSSQESANWFNPIAKPVAVANTFQPLVTAANTSQNIDLNENPTRPQLIDPVNFFNQPEQQNNNRSAVPAAQTPQDISNNFQIQNFFNNPPLLSDTQTSEQDRNFNYFETNLINKRLHNITTTQSAAAETETTGSISSNLVEPASSAQSEFSEYADIGLLPTSTSDDYLNRNQVMRAAGGSLYVVLVCDVQSNNYSKTRNFCYVFLMKFICFSFIFNRICRMPVLILIIPEHQPNQTT